MHPTSDTSTKSKGTSVPSNQGGAGGGGPVLLPPSAETVVAVKVPQVCQVGFRPSGQAKWNSSLSCSGHSMVPSAAA